VRRASGGGFCCAYNLTSKLRSPSCHPLASFQNDLDCTLPLHSTSHALLACAAPHQREIVCGACIGTTQVGASLAASLDSLLKQSSVRSLCDAIFKTCTSMKKVSTRRACTPPGTQPYPSCSVYVLCLFSAPVACTLKVTFQMV